MSTTINDMPESTAAAVAEATRIASQAARNGTESAKASFEAASSLFDDTNTMARDLMTTWTAQAELAIKGAFDAQNTAIDAGLGLFDLGFKGNRQAVAQFSAIVKRTQKATLESWQTTAKMAAKATESTKR